MANQKILKNKKLMQHIFPELQKGNDDSLQVLKFTDLIYENAQLGVIY